MDTVIQALRPPFRLAKFEGDAAFVYAVTEKLDGSRLQHSIETAYDISDPSGLSIVTSRPLPLAIGRRQV
jgi:hypothetical protein